MSNWNRSTKTVAATAALAAFALVAPAAATAAPNPGAGHDGSRGALGLEAEKRPGQEVAQERATGKGARAPKTLDAEQRAIVDGIIPNGGVGAVARVESPGFTGAYASGKRALDGNPKALPHSEFRVASNAKMMVATAAMQQVERGAWTLQTTIGDVLPGLVPGHDSVTLEQLLSHTSGMPDGLGVVINSKMTDQSNDAFFAALGADYSDQEIVDAMNSLPWAFEPGTDFLHSNTGYVVVGMMLEQQTGRSMADLLKRDVLKPAGMNQTTLKAAAGMRGQGLEGAAIIGDQSWALPHFNHEVFSSAGSVVSTTKDMNAFTEALMQGRLVNPALVEQMKTPRSTKSLQYGLGLYRLPDPCSPASGELAWVYGHDGGAFGTVSTTMTSPDGSRQVSVGVTGRHSYDDPFQPQPYDHVTRMMQLLATTC